MFPLGAHLAKFGYLAIVLRNCGDSVRFSVPNLWAPHSFKEASGYPKSFSFLDIWRLTIWMKVQVFSVESQMGIFAD